MIEIQNLTKSYQSLVALDNISLTIPRGEVVGLLGPNGAGKTTLFKLIAGILHPDAGEIRPSSPQWPAIAYKQERLLFPNRMRISEYLTMAAHIANVPPAQIPSTVTASLTQVGLRDTANKRISTCSKGMRQRLALAQTLLGNADLLLLDEPSNGLDPNGQGEIHQLIQQLQALGKTIIISSHQLPEVMKVCSMLVILNNGRIHYQKRMTEAFDTPRTVTIRTDRDATPLAADLLAIHSQINIQGDSIVLPPQAIASRRDVISLLLSHNYDILQVAQQSLSLSEIYAEVVS